METKKEQQVELLPQKEPLLPLNPPKLGAKEKARPFSGVIIFCLLILLLLNAVVISLHFIYQRQNKLGPFLLLVPTIRFALLLDAAILSILGFYFVVHGLLVMMKKFSRQHSSLMEIFLFIQTFEPTLLLFSWGVTWAMLYPTFLSHYFQTIDDRAENFIWGAIISVLSVSVASAIKRLLLNAMISYIHRDLQPAIMDSLHKENMLFILERDPNQARLWRPKSYFRKLEAFSGKPSTWATTIWQEYEFTGKESIELKDLKSFFRKSQVEEIFRVFDLNKDWKISFNEFQFAVKTIFEERKSLVDRMKTRRGIVDITETLMGFVYGVIAVVLVMLSFSLDITAFLVSVGTLFVGLSFAYGKTLQEVFDSLYMLYIVQPFDVGDIISVADGPHLRSEQVGILTSYFLSPDGYGVYLRNEALCRQKIVNFNRGNQTVVSIVFGLKADVTEKEVKELNQRLSQHLLSNPKMWSKRFILFGLGPEPQLRFQQFQLRARLKKGAQKWQDLDYCRHAKTELALVLQGECSTLGLLPNNMYIPVEQIGKLKIQ